MLNPVEELVSEWYFVRRNVRVGTRTNLGGFEVPEQIFLQRTLHSPLIIGIR